MLKINKGLIRFDVRVALFVALLISACVPQTKGASVMEDSFFSLSEEVVTPHTEWAKPYYLGKVKALVFAPRFAQRETVELAQRLSLDYTAVMTSFHKQLDRGVRGAQNQGDVIEDLKKALERDYDVIIMAGIDWGILPEEAKTLILGKVNSGTGLFCSFVENSPAVVGEAIKQKPVDEASLLITEGVPLKALPEFRAVVLSPQELIAAGILGMGRVILMRYPGNLEIDINCLTVNTYGTMEPGDVELIEIHYDYHQSLLIKALLWAANKEPDIRIREMSLPEPEIDYRDVSAQKVNLKLISKRAGASQTKVSLIIRDQNGIEAKEEKDVIVQSGENPLALSMPRLKAGSHFVDVFLAEKDGRVIDWASAHLKVSSRFCISKITLGKEFYRTGDVIEGKVVFNKVYDLPDGRQAGERSRLRVRLIDNFERRISEKEVVLEPGRQEVAFDFRLETPLTGIMRVTGELYRGEELLQEVVEKFPVRLPWEADDFSFVMWCWGWDDYVNRLVNRQVRKYGVDTALVYYPNELGAQGLAEDDLRIIPYSFGIGQYEGESLIRVPCFTDPVTINSFQAALRSTASTFGKYVTVGYDLGDEGLLTRSMKADVCFSKTCQEDFRGYLKNIYGTVEALNKEWETDYQDWADVKPMTLDEAKKRGNLAPWADHRMHMESVFADIHDFCKGILREIDPEVRVGVEGNYQLSSWSGYDWWKLSRVFGQWAGYSNDPLTAEQMRSFMGRETLRSLGWYGAYSHERSNEDVQRYVPWYDLFHGFNSSFFFKSYGHAGRHGGDYQSALAPDLRPAPCFLWTGEEIKEIKSGVAKLLLNAKRENDGIAIHYSQSSLHASTAYPHRENRLFPLSMVSGPPYTSLTESQGFFYRGLESLRLQYEFISYAQLERGDLESGKYRVLILPYSQSLSDKEASRIREFVRQGGLLLADLRPGLMDEHCKFLPHGSLDDVFGIRSDDANLQVTTAQALEEEKGIPRTIVNQFGQGKAVLLNRSLGEYAQAGENERGLLRDALRLGEITSRIGITTLSGDEFGGSQGKAVPLNRSLDEFEGCEVVRFTAGEAEYVGLIKESGKVSKVKITFPRKAHLYDVRAKSYLGFTEQVEAELVPGRAKLYALLPYKVGGISLKTENSFKRGQTVDYQLTLKVLNGTPLSHAVSLTVYGPDNKPVDYYGKNLFVQGGTYSGKIPLAMNEQEGKWKIEATDVVSGTRAEASFKVR